jgi:hypothetical protein
VALTTNINDEEASLYDSALRKEASDDE